MDAVCLADNLSTELDQVSGPVVLSAKVQNTLTTPLYLRRKVTIATYQAANVVPKAELQSESEEEPEPTPTDDCTWLLDKLDLMSLETYTSSQQEVACQLLIQNSNLFSKHLLDLGETDICTHNIKLTDETPFKEPY